MPSISLPQRLSAFALLAGAIFAGGCSTTSPPVKAPLDLVAGPILPTHEYIPVVRQGRYTLVELAPAAAQRDLLLQIVEVSLPEEAGANVGDGLRHLLKRSGYRLREDHSAASELYALPLPLAHQRLGPMTLRDALLTLAGPGWSMQVDDRARQIRFTRTIEETETTESASVAAETAQIFPVTEGALP
ncbi:PilL N-terminal domain-containing protein [Pseudomonas aeruginosa]|nr:PilL N-terminal domain-containing protein [Pseudomonas aeruginosa]MDI3744195.1 PilL N-terminal domain-containing protein [Pseudomonas aeruginosa]